MSFINARSFGNSNLTYFEVRGECYKLNYKLLIQFFSFTYLTFLLSIVGSLVDHVLPPGFHNPITFKDYPKAFYPWYIVFNWLCIPSALLGPNSCMFFGSLMSFLRNEFKILGIAYSNVFKNLIDEQICDESLDDILSKLKVNVKYHVKLLK